MVIVVDTPFDTQDALQNIGQGLLASFELSFVKKQILLLSIALRGFNRFQTLVVFQTGCQVNIYKGPDNGHNLDPRPVPVTF